MKNISIRESLLQIDKDTYCAYDLSALYESCRLTEEDKEKLVQYIEDKDIDSMNSMLTANSFKVCENVGDDLTDEEARELGLMDEAWGDIIKDSAKRLGGAIKDSKLGQKVSNSKIGQAVSNAVSDIKQAGEQNDTLAGAVQTIKNNRAERGVQQAQQKLADAEERAKVAKMTSTEKAQHYAQKTKQAKAEIDNKYNGKQSSKGAQAQAGQQGKVAPKSYYYKGQMINQVQYNKLGSNQKRDVTIVGQDGTYLQKGRDRNAIGKKANMKKKTVWVAESLNENTNYDFSGLNKSLRAGLPAEEIDHHDSDLYVKVSPKSKEILKNYGIHNHPMLSTFIDNIDHVRWYDIPFAYVPESGLQESFDKFVDIDSVVIGVSNLLDEDKLGDNWIEVFPIRNNHPDRMVVEITGADETPRKAVFASNGDTVNVAFKNGSEGKFQSVEEIARFIAGEYGLTL